MTKARNLQHGDALRSIKIGAEILSIETLPNGMIKLRVAAIGAPSLEVSYASGVIEFICKPGREFNSHPIRWDDGRQWPPRPDGDDDDDDGDDGGPDAPAPSNLEPAT